MPIGFKNYAFAPKIAKTQRIEKYRVCLALFAQVAVGAVIGTSPDGFIGDSINDYSVKFAHSAFISYQLGGYIG